MKTARLSLFLVWSFALSVFGAAPVSLLVETNGALRAPTTFFSVNSAAITALSSGVYQPVDADLTAFAGISAVTGDIIYHNGTNWVRLPKGTDGQTLQLSSGFPTWATVVGGGAGDVTLAGTNAFTGPNSFAGTTTFNGAANLNGTTTISNLTVPGTMTVGSVSFGTPLGLSGGGHGGTNVLTAQQNLSLVPDEDVQVFSARLKQLATVSWASGDVPYFDGSNLTNLATTAAGRTLLAAANAAAQWDAIKSDALQSGSYDQAAWDGVTGKAVTPDQVRDIIQNLAIGSNAIVSVTSPLTLTNGVLSINTEGLGGGGGVEWLANDGLGTWQGRDAGTNWVFASFTISSNDVPTTTGQYIFGRSSMVLSNYSGGSATVWIDADLAGTKVFRSSHTVNVATSPGKPYVFDYAIVKESGNTLSLVVFGGNGGTSADPYIGNATGSMVSDIFFATNVAYTATSNLVFEMRAQSESTNATPEALGIRRVQSSMLRYTTATAGTGDVVGPASSTTNNIAVFADATGKVIADGGVAIAELATEAEVAAGYQPLDDDLTDLADGSLTGSKVGSGIDAGNITTGTLSSNRLPAAVSFTTVDVGTINATAVVGDASGLTGINATNITSGELADARIPAAIARDSEVSATYAPLASPALTGDPTAPTAAANDNDTSIATTAYVQAEETALKAANLWQATNAALTALAGNPSLYQTTNGNLTTLAGASITGAGNFMRTRTGVPREIWIPASAMNPGSDAPTPATNTWATTTDGQRWEGWDFSATSTNSVYFLLALPSAWDAGTVKAKIMWKQVVAAATATNSWQIGGGSLTDGETGGNTLGTLVEVLDVGANDTNVVSVSAASGAITIGGTPSAGHLTWFTVRRHPGDTDDNYAELSRLIGLHLQYTETATEPSAW